MCQFTLRAKTHLLTEANHTYVILEDKTSSFITCPVAILLCLVDMTYVKFNSFYFYSNNYLDFVTCWTGMMVNCCGLLTSNKEPGT